MNRLLLPFLTLNLLLVLSKLALFCLSNRMLSHSYPLAQIHTIPSFLLIITKIDILGLANRSFLASRTKQTEVITIPSFESCVHLPLFLCSCAAAGVIGLLTFRVIELPVTRYKSVIICKKKISDQLQKSSIKNHK